MAMAVCSLLLAAESAFSAEASGPAKTAELLPTGTGPCRIVCFGDSITGIYYHTGGRRAWCDMLGIALQRVYPKAKLEMVNAGISGHTTVNALKRIRGDVLAKKPHLVVVMFGMNDVTRVPQAVYERNLRTIVAQCRGVGAEVILCTPNSIYPEDRGRPVAKLAAYAETVRRVAKDMAVPLADCWKAYEDVRAKDPLAWKLLMSETIHPNMHGHKLFAEVIARVISGRDVSLDDVRAAEPCVPHGLRLLAKGKPIKLVAMEPFDQIMPRVLSRMNPKCKVSVTTWPAKGKTLAEIAAWGKSVRDRKPDLVVVAVPHEALPRGEESREALLRSYSWVLNLAVPFGRATWDTIAVLPGVARPGLTAADQPNDRIVRRVVLGQDIGVIDRPLGQDAPAEDIVLRWLRARQKAAKR